MRRAVRRTSAAIFSKRKRMVATCAVAHGDPVRFRNIWIREL